MYIYDFYTLRIPAFSFNKLTKMNAVLGSIRQNGELNEDDISEMKNIFSDDTFFASTVLFKELKKWLAGG